MALKIKREVDINPRVVAAVPSRTMSMAVAVRDGLVAVEEEPQTCQQDRHSSQGVAQGSH